jgi:polyprenyl-phospho-N-acetylgalactosaminyl synthase
MKNTVLIIIPSFNDSKTVVEITRKIIKLGYDVIVIDDASTDETKNLLIANRFNFISHEKNEGQGAALLTGMNYAFKNNYDLIVHFDADGQHQVEDIAKIVEPIIANSCDVSLGSRFLNIKYINMPLKKLILLKLGRYVEFMFSGILLSDVHNGFRAMNRKAYSQMDLKLKRMAHASEIIIKIRKAKLRYLEVPITVKYFNNVEKKEQSFRSALKIVWALIKYKFKLT